MTSGAERLRDMRRRNVLRGRNPNGYGVGSKPPVGLAFFAGHNLNPADDAHNARSKLFKSSKRKVKVTLPSLGSFK